MATVAEQLAEAQAAYHELVMGKAPRVVVDMSGERVEFVAANRQQLYLYIQSLQTQLAAPVTPPANCPASFLF